MKIQFWSIGKANEPYIRAGLDDFTKRINRFYKVEWKIIPVPKNASQLSEPELKKKEAETILGLLTKEDYLVALDENGKALSSTGLADFLQARANDSVKNLVFLIGGAYG